MRGEHPITVRNNKVQIKLPIRRNLTILQGNSATGKTTLIGLIAQYEELGESSGVVINCDAPCRVLSGRNWERDLESIENSIVFVDEDNAFIKTHEFAHAARHSSNYYVLVAREALPQLPYSVDEIYGLRNTTRSSSKYPAYNRVHTSVYRIFGSLAFDGGRPEVVIVEDSNSGYEFYRALCEKSGIRCVSADFFSWEQFFTKELVEVTADTYLAYRKKSLNTAYLQPKEMAALKKALPDLGL